MNQENQTEGAATVLLNKSTIDTLFAYIKLLMRVMFLWGW